MIDNKLLEKANLFNNFLKKQCSPISNESTVPVIRKLGSRERLSYLELGVQDIVVITRLLDQNKADGHDEIPISLIKLCTCSILKPLHLIFRNCLESALISTEWKKVNIIPVHKKVINN